jgi:hypothetical protein
LVNELNEQGVRRIGDLEIAQDLRFQRRSWAIQRVGWFAMAVVVAAAVLGYLGEGPLSDARARSGDGAYEVEYARYTRYRSPDTLRVFIEEGAVEGDQARVSFGRGYFDGVEVESVFPEPDSVEVDGDEVVYLFKLGDQGAPATVIFSVMYDDVGRKRARVGLDGHSAVSFSQFIYP